MKNKATKEGFKFIVLTAIQGFVVNFSPDGRIAAKLDQSLDVKITTQSNSDDG